LKQQYADARASMDLDILPTVAGQAIGLIHECLPAADIVMSMMAEAEKALTSGAGTVR
jgi:hypothetical protein